MACVEGGLKMGDAVKAAAQNKERPEGYLGSAPLMFVSSRMSPRACRPPSS